MELLMKICRYSNLKEKYSNKFKHIVNELCDYTLIYRILFVILKFFS